jgi:hypothetical protein
MSQPIASTAIRPPAFRDHADSPSTDHTRRTDPGRRPTSRVWTLIQALGYAGALVDPSGILAVERLRQAKEAQEARDATR